MFEAIVDAIHSLVVWFFDIIVAMAMGLLQVFLAVFPMFTPVVEQGISVWQGLIYYVEVANGWVPIDYALTLMGLYYGFLLAFVIVKYILKLTPFIG